MILFNVTPEIVEKLVEIRAPVVVLVDEVSALPGVVATSSAAPDYDAGGNLTQNASSDGGKAMVARRFTPMTPPPADALARVIRIESWDAANALISKIEFGCDFAPVLLS